MARKCWASTLGGCDALSREHVVSRSVLRQAGGQLGVKGTKRVPDGERGIDDLTASVLCRKHNAELSQLDSEAGRLMEFLRASTNPLFQGDLVADGKKLERWALKTAINSVASGWSDEAKWAADSIMVRSIFGYESVPLGCGLYFAETGARYEGHPLEFSFSPLWTDPPEAKQLAGGFLALNGLTFFLSTIPHIVESFGALAKPGSVYARHSYVYRPGRITLHRESGGNVQIQLDW